VPELRSIAKREAERIARALDSELRAELVADAIGMLDGWDGIRVELCPETDVADRCTVAGGYAPGPPPRISVALAASPGRRQFSALHEYGHHLIAGDERLADDVFPDFADGGEALEEAICDAFAAEILLPDELVDRHLPPEGPTARSIANLFANSAASREACCVRGSQRLRGPGYVMLAEGRVARFTACHDLPWKVRRGTDQGERHLIAHAARTGAARHQTQIRYARGGLSSPLWGDAVATGDGYVFAVFMSNSAPWQALNIFSVNDDRPTSVCRVCDWEFEVWGRRCQGCGEPPCPVHNVCWCEEFTVPTRQCKRCFLVLPVSQFTGDNEICDSNCGG